MVQEEEAHQRRLEEIERLQHRLEEMNLERSQA